MKEDKGKLVPKANDVSALDTGHFVKDWDNMEKVASKIVKAGLLPKAINTPEKAIAVMLTAKELNIPPMEGLRMIYIVDQKPALMSQLMLSLAYSRGILENVDIQESEKKCSVTMKRKGIAAPYTATFGEEDAKRAGLLYRDNYKKYPAAMYRSRAISACLRVVAPDVIGGLYTPEEIEAHIDTQGVVDAVAVSEDLSDPEKYKAWSQEFLEKMLKDMEGFEIPFDVEEWRRGHKEEIGRLTEEDQKYLNATLDEKHGALVRMEEDHNQKPAPTITIEEYLEMAHDCKTVEDLVAWFKQIDAQAQKELHKDDYAKLIEECKKIKEKLQKK
jgi:hypothetical protein